MRKKSDNAMDCDREIPVKAGWLNKVQNIGGISLNNNTKVSKKKSTTTKYCMLFDASQHGIERLEICESEQDTKNPTIVTLENCVKIMCDPSGEITVWTKTGQLVLNADEEEAKSWEHSLKSVAFKEKLLKQAQRNSVIETDNELYYSSYDEGVFEVMLMPLKPEVAERCKLESKKYILELATGDIRLKDIHDKNLCIVKWPFRFIRKYGYRNSNFTFEAGRKSVTGEGLFHFEHNNPIDIFRCMVSRTKIMKNLIKCDNSVSLDCGELSAALSMEAGSRNPLPPSKSTEPTPEFETAITQSQMSLTRVAISGATTADDTATSATSATTNVMPVPPKPRKTLTLPLVLPQNQQGSPVPVPPRKQGNDYAVVHNITDAWRSLGIAEPHHTERKKSPEKDLMEFSFNSRGTSRNASRTKISPIAENNNIDDFAIKTTRDEGSSYERLDFLRSTSKQSNGYETVSNLKKSPISFVTPDDYEEMGSPSTESMPDTKACRLADDSYQGYGKLRKITTPTSPTIIGLPPTPSMIDPTTYFVADHGNYNPFSTYTFVGKPKHV